MFNLLDFCSLFAVNLGKGCGSRLSADHRDSTSLAGRPGIFSDRIFQTLPIHSAMGKYSSCRFLA